MKIFVMVDMEGISGICKSEQVSASSPHYADGRRFLTDDVNACVDGLFAGGAKKVVVRDAHSSGFNLLWDQLDERAEYIQGRSGKERMPGIKRFDGLILLGYHAMAGTPEAILEHTMSSKGWQNFYLNGKKAGEIAIDAGMAADHDVPTIMVSGDDKLCREARKQLPDVLAVQVKKGLDCQGGQLLSRKAAHDKIRQGSSAAVGLCGKIKPQKISSPVRMRLEVVSRGMVPRNRKGVKVIDGRTYEVTGKTVEEALNAL